MRLSLYVSLGGACLAGSVCRAELVGIHWGGRQNLWDISTADGSISNPRPTDTGAFGGFPIGFTFGADSSTGYVITTLEDNDVYRVDAATGAAERVGPTGTTVTEGDLRYNRATGVLWGVWGDGTAPRASRAFTIDVSTGAATMMSNLDLDDPSGLDFDSTGNAWVLESLSNSVGNSILHRVDLATGAKLDSVPLDRKLAPSAGIAFDNKGTLFAVSGQHFDPNLYTINMVTGATSIVGDTTLSNWLGLAFIPSPGSTAALGVAMMGVAWRRRR